MSVLLYNIFLALFRAGIHIASLFNPKAAEWVNGRKGQFDKLKAAVPPGEKIIWVHCASLGEFEQGRPVIEKLRDEYPGYRVMLTFFSPSGYEVQKNYTGADWVFYLPMDGALNAKRFIETVKPCLVIFVKYEFWYYYLKKIKYRNIPLILISALFRKDMPFFKWHGVLQRKMLSRFDHLFVQNISSEKLLDDIGLGNITSVSGDTRFDRVAAIAAQAEPLPGIQQFIADKKTIIAGSTWKEDEALLSAAFPYFEKNDIKLIIAPHEINPGNLSSVKERFPGSVFYSALQDNEVNPRDHKCLIIDNIGMLSRLYSYAFCCYVGGGLSRNGVHNVLEAAVYGKPVFFGPYYKKYHEAIDLADTKAAFPVNGHEELEAQLGGFLQNAELYVTTCNKAGNYVKDNTGAVKKITDWIQEKRLLTN